MGVCMSVLSRNPYEVAHNLGKLCHIQSSSGSRLVEDKCIPLHLADNIPMSKSQRLASFAKHSPNTSPAKPTSPSPSTPYRDETTIHRKARVLLLDLRQTIEYWDDIVLSDGLKVAKS